MLKQIYLIGVVVLKIFFIILPRIYFSYAMYLLELLYDWYK